MSQENCKSDKTQKPQYKKKKKKKSETFEVGIIGWIRVHLGSTFPFATHVSQCKPESQFLSFMHVCFSCYRGLSLETGSNSMQNGLKMLLCTLRASEEWRSSKRAKRVVAVRLGFCNGEREKERRNWSLCFETQEKQSMEKKILPALFFFVDVFLWWRRENVRGKMKYYQLSLSYKDRMRNFNF